MTHLPGSLYYCDIQNLIMKVTILDPVLCCTSGLCGSTIDEALVQTSANVKWLRSLGHDVHRHSLSNDAVSFKDYPSAIEKIQHDGIESLPYILINNRLVLTGRYPEKAEWEALAAQFNNSHEPAGEPIAVRNACCPGDNCC